VGGGRQELSGCRGAGRRTQQGHGCHHGLCPWHPASQVFGRGGPADGQGAWTGLCPWLEGGGGKAGKHSLQWLVLWVLQAEGVETSLDVGCTVDIAQADAAPAACCRFPPPCLLQQSCSALEPPQHPTPCPAERDVQRA